MENAISHQQKIERLETEKRQLEDRIRQLEHAAHTAERKRLTRAKIILGSLVRFRHLRKGLATARRAPAFLSYKPEHLAHNMAIFHLSIRPISRAKGHSAVARIAYDTRCKLTNDPAKSTTRPSISRM